MRGLHEQGKPVFSLLSDFAQGIRESYIGLNNMKVGRSAGWLISRTAPHPGKVALFVGSHRWHGHELRETGLPLVSASMRRNSRCWKRSSTWRRRR